MPAKSPYYISITANTVVRLQLVPAAYADATLRTQLGILEGTAAGSAPTGQTVVGTGRLAAAQRGCFGVNLVYNKTGGKTQSAKVMVSPTKADTVFSDTLGAKYNAKDIIEVRVPRRRVYTF